MIDRLQNVQKSAARLIARGRKFDHITPVMKELHWLPVSHRIIYKIIIILLITYKALNGLAPSYIRDMLQPLKSTMNLSSSMKGLLSVPPPPPPHHKVGQLWSKIIFICMQRQNYGMNIVCQDMMACNAGKLQKSQNRRPYLFDIELYLAVHKSFDSGH